MKMLFNVLLYIEILLSLVQCQKIDISLRFISQAEADKPAVDNMMRFHFSLFVFHLLFSPFLLTTQETTDNESQLLTIDHDRIPLENATICSTIVKENE